MNEVLEQREGAVVTLTLNRPERLNAIVPELSAMLREALPRIAADGGIGAVVLTGQGGGSARAATCTPWKAAPRCR